MSILVELYIMIANIVHFDDTSKIDDLSKIDDASKIDNQSNVPPNVDNADHNIHICSSSKLFTNDEKDTYTHTYLTYNQWIKIVNDVFEIRFGTISKFLHTKYAQKNLSFYSNFTASENITDYLVDDDYYQIYHSGSNPQDAGIYACKKSYSIWYKLVEEFVFSTKNVFLDDLFKFHDQKNLLEEYFNVGYNWEKAGSEIINQYNSNSKYDCSLFFKWMNNIDKNVYKKISRHIDNLSDVDKIFPANYVENFKNNTNCLVISNLITKTYIWLREVKKAIYGYCGKESNNFNYLNYLNYLNLAHCYRQNKKPIEAACIICRSLKSVKQQYNNKPNIEFDQWLKCVDKLVYTNINFHLIDLLATIPNKDFKTKYDNGYSVETMASFVIKNYKKCFGFYLN